MRAIKYTADGLQVAGAAKRKKVKNEVRQMMLEWNTSRVRYLIAKFGKHD